MFQIQEEKQLLERKVFPETASDKGINSVSGKRKRYARGNLSADKQRQMQPDMERD